MPIELRIACPDCGAEQRFVVWESLNVTLDPDRKQELLNGELTQLVCAQCGWSGEVVYPMLYHDMAKRLMILLAPPGDEPPIEALPLVELIRDYDLRVVTTRNELVEKILIFDAGLDDRVVEGFKLVIQRSMLEGERPFAGLLWFVEVACSESGEEVIRFELQKADSAHLLEIPLDSFHRVGDSIAARLPAAETGTGQWLKVDAAYAQRYVDAEEE